MIDIKNFRENPDYFVQKSRDKNTEIDAQKILDLDAKKRELQTRIEAIRSEKNAFSKNIGTLSAEERKKALVELKEKDIEAGTINNELKQVDKELTQCIEVIPNPAFDDVKVGKDETENEAIRSWGEKTAFDFTPKPHWELGKDLDVLDNERAAEISGARFTYIKGDLALLQFALVQLVMSTVTDSEKLRGIIDQFGLEDVSDKPFIPVVPPVFVRPEVMQRMARLEPRDERYHIVSDDQYLVGSAEHTLGPLHMDEVIDEKAFPIRYIGYSTAFRREAGSYGKDTRGIIRLHQFDKVEMESFSVPENSVKEQNLFVAIQEYLMRQLEIPYQVVAICTGDMGGPDARQIDIECWMPGQDVYKETHTSDLMTDYQSRRLQTRVRRENKKTELVHMNDATAFAIGRTLVAIMENYQQKDGTIRIPKVLQPYVGGREVITRLS